MRARRCCAPCRGRLSPSSGPSAWRTRPVPPGSCILREYLREPTWTLPAHDRDLGSFKGTDYTIDLASSATAYELAQALWMLGSRLDGAVRAEVIAVLETRIFAPFRASLRGEKRHWWMTGTNNWNPVCLAGTVGAALAVLPDRNDRAAFAAAGELYSRHYLEGFTGDGYCSEGIGYWNYGMSNYLMLREHLWQATLGRVDLFRDERVREAALYGIRVEICDGVFPAIADCRPGSTPSAQILRYCSLALGLGLRNHEAAWDPMRPDNLTSSPMEIFPNSITARPAATSAEGLGLRSWFKDAGLLVCRPAPGGPVALGAAFKGGHNDEHHNHNDVGSFSVALGGRMPVGDPGGPYVYNAKTFSGERYTALKLFGSFSHPVPRVDGKDQKPGRKAAARVLDTSFADASDRIVFDLAAAYDVPGLVKLERAFVLNRGDSPSIGVRDTFAAGRPVAFETALTTRAAWKRISPAVLEFTLDGRVLRCDIDTAGAAFEITSEKIEEDCIPFERIGIRLLQPAGAGTTALRLTASGG
ncbi:MAG: heparinase II/III family protein [Kiritimatiellia bacterium]